MFLFSVLQLIKKCITIKTNNIVLTFKYVVTPLGTSSTSTLEAQGVCMIQECLGAQAYTNDCLPGKFYKDNPLFGIAASYLSFCWPTVAIPI